MKLKTDTIEKMKKIFDYCMDGDSRKKSLPIELQSFYEAILLYQEGRNQQVWHMENVKAVAKKERNSDLGDLMAKDILENSEITNDPGNLNRKIINEFINKPLDI